ncbi:estradiol 17-beta-dehydrogenase 8 [Cephus cinctus]|uniref:(3R)-3-hydroxyacyl-CoA dehydrogenase n=1 Tax=Cephus cinctus TaxID=211228 RepID=A0AAJ7W491_CEPCN|nr:estradiol 17-beta-dehydrogenase 8 [Cephus cinctus]
MSNLVAGKLAFVTGAGSGIGRAVCRVLAREGAQVIATDQNIKTAEETVSTLTGTGHLSLEIDVSSSQSVDNVLKKTLDTFAKPPTIVVNSAGITRDNFLLKLDENDFDRVLQVNLRGTFLVIQKIVNILIEAKQSNGTSIVNMGSIIGKFGNIGQVNYGASKAGVENITKTAAAEFGKFGVRVNTVLPGFISTPMTDVVPDKIKEIFMNKIALRRLGKPEEVAELVLFLASDRSSYINGASIEITGGMN